MVDNQPRIGTDGDMENLERVLCDTLTGILGGDSAQVVSEVDHTWNRVNTRRYVATTVNGDQVAVAIWGAMVTSLDDSAAAGVLGKLCEGLNLKWSGTVDAELASPVVSGWEHNNDEGGVAVLYASARRAPSSMKRLHDVEMTVTAELGRTRMKLKQVLDLIPGAVVELDRIAGSPIDVLVNGRPVARGEVVVIDEEFGVRITEIISDGDE